MHSRDNRARMTPHIEQQAGHIPRLGLEFRQVARGIIGEGSQIHPGTEIFASAREQNNSHAPIRRRSAQGLAKFGEHFLIERIAALRTVERDPRDTPVCSV
jgi:hypothetical protein